MSNKIWIKYYQSGLLQEVLTFKQVEQLAETYSADLKSSGLVPGDRVIVKLPNSPKAVIAYLALRKLRMIAVPVHPGESAERLQFIINDCGARAIIDEGQEIGLLSKGNIEIQKNALNIDKIATIIYTSGTTGVPKGVCLGEENWKANAQSLIKHHKLSSDTILATSLPLFHCNAHGLGMYATLASRARLILFDGVTENFLNILNEEQVNILSLVPAILHRLCENSNNWKPSPSLKYILTAAAPLTAELLNEATGKLGVRIIQGFGLSESTNFSCTMPINLTRKVYDSIMMPYPSVGTALPGVEIRVGKDDAAEVSNELYIRSKSNFLGYWGSSIRPNEWVATGDIGCYKLYEGIRYYYLNGRIKELINRAGEKFSPLEIEREIRASGNTFEFAIIPIRDKVYGEEVGMVCVKKIGLEFLQKIPKYRRPKKIYQLPELFQTATGKIQRRKMAEYCALGKAKILYER